MAFSNGTKCCVFLTLFLFLQCAVKCAVLPNLTIIGCLPMTGKNWVGGGAILPPMLMAVDIINSRDDILSGYNLNLQAKNCMCDPGLAVNKVYAMLYTPPVKHFMTGPGCSAAAEAVARSSHVWNITHLSYAAASPMLSNKELFPKFFRVGAPDTRFNVARLAMLRYFNWKKIALIDVAMDYFFYVTDDFLQLVKTMAPDIQIISQEIFNWDPLQRIQYLKSKDARIIFGGGYENHGRAILCACSHTLTNPAVSSVHCEFSYLVTESNLLLSYGISESYIMAYRVGLYGPKVVWVFPGWYGEYWWRSDLELEDVPCTSEQMDMAADGHLLTSFPYYNADVEKRGISGINVREFWEQFRSHPIYQPQLKNKEHLSGNAFDSIFGGALALNCTDAYLKEIEHPKTLVDFDYDGDIGNIITECTRNLTFLGISGDLDLSKGDSIKSVKLDQIYKLEKRHVGMFDHGHNEGQSSERWTIGWVNGGIIWRGGYAPRDSTQVTIIEITVPPYLYVLMSSLASIGILISVTLFLFNVQHRKHVFVKLSSPNINSVLLLGCVCTYSTVFMTSYTSENVALCKVRAFTLTLGFSMAFGAMFSKTWRVYKIFANKKLLRVKIQDSQLIGIVGALLAVLTTVLVLHEIIDPLVIETQFRKTEVYLNGNDAEIHPYIRKCVSRYQDYFSWTIYIIEGVLLVFGAFLSFETRKVRIAALNDSHQIGMCLYSVIALATVALTLSLALDTHVALVYAIISGFIVLGTTGTQLIVFIPKIMAVYWPHRLEPSVTNAIGGFRPRPALAGSSISKLNILPSRSASPATVYTIEEQQMPDKRVESAT